MRVESDLKLGFKDVLFRPKRSNLKSRSEVSLCRIYTFKHTNTTWEGIPIIAANMDSIGTFSMAESLEQAKLITALHKHYTIDEWGSFLENKPKNFYKHFFLSTGISNTDFEKMNQLLKNHPEISFVCIDVANGYTEYFVKFLEKVREHFPHLVIAAGNVVTPEMVEELIISGADLVKVGIGPGSVCTTRVKTGVGYPQLSAIIECADAAHGLGGHVISDGGCVNPGDVAKAFGGGADFVMLGGMFSGHKEGNGTIIEKDSKKYMEFYGMSSSTAMEKHSGGVGEYRASEGKTVCVPYKGPVEETLKDILGGVRSTCTYVGAARLKELSKRTTFIKVREQENLVFS